LDNSREWDEGRWGGGEDREVVNIGADGDDGGKAEERADKEVENEEEKVGGDGAALADTSDDSEGGGRAVRKREVGGGGGEDIGNVVEKEGGGVYPLKGIEDGVPVKKIKSLPEVRLDEEEEGGAVSMGEEPVANGEEVAKGGAAWKESMLGGVEERGDEGDER